MRLTAANGRSPRDASERSLTLLHMFLGASALILGVGAFVLSTLLTSGLTSQAIADHRDSLTLYVDGVLGPALLRGRGRDRPALPPGADSGGSARRSPQRPRNAVLAGAVVDAFLAAAAARLAEFGLPPFELALRAV